MRRVFSGFGAFVALGLVVGSTGFADNKANKVDGGRPVAVPDSRIQNPNIKANPGAIVAPRVATPDLAQPGGKPVAPNNGAAAGSSHGSGGAAPGATLRGTGRGTGGRVAPSQTPGVAGRVVAPAAALSGIDTTKLEVKEINASIVKVAPDRDGMNLDGVRQLGSKMIDLQKGESTESVAAVQTATAYYLSKEVIDTAFGGDKAKAVAALEKFLLSFLHDPKAAVVELATIKAYLDKGDAESVGAALGLIALTDMYAVKFNEFAKSHGLEESLKLADAEWSKGVVDMFSKAYAEEMNRKFDDPEVRKKAEEAMAGLCEMEPPCAQKCRARKAA